jgi:CO/xanthine dehydrogenase Mo-binding subunit
VLLQYVGEVLHAPMERVRIVAADTETTPVDKGAYASSTTYATGNAVVMAATKLKAQLEEGARLVLGSERPLSFDGESFIDEGGAAALGLADFLARVNYYKRAGGYFKAEDIPQLSASARYGSPWAPAPYVAGFAELEVDRGTGELRLLKFVAVADCGTVINPKLARIQLEGGIVMGAGYALQEEVRYTENGRLLSNSFLEYRIPSVEDIPFELETAFEESYEPNGPFGAKSLGEVVVHTPPAAIANALFNATGARVRSLPLTPDKVLRALDEAGASR